MRMANGRDRGGWTKIPAIGRAAMSWRPQEVAKGLPMALPNELPNKLSNFSLSEFYNSRAIAAACTRLLDAALPQRCALCNARSGAALVCSPCRRDLPALPPACPRCALPSPLGATCGACLARPPPQDATIAACRYAHPLDGLVHELKYGGRLALARLFGELLAARARENRRAPSFPDAVVAVPLAPKRQRERGFNQAQEIARCVARHTGIPLLHGLARIRHTPAQATLDWNARRANLVGAFVASAAVSGRRIAIVDDVMTSGATLHAAARAARAAGAAGIEAWVVARTLP
jgi:ComF family protein